MTELGGVTKPVNIGEYMGLLHKNSSKALFHRDTAKSYAIRVPFEDL